jgi:hypothetical protein
MTFVGRENNMQILREYFYLEVIISSLFICYTRGDWGDNGPPPSLYVYCFYMFTRFARVLIGHRLLRRQILFPTLKYIPTFQPQETIFFVEFGICMTTLRNIRGNCDTNVVLWEWLMWAGVRAAAHKFTIYQALTMWIDSVNKFN